MKQPAVDLVIRGGRVLDAHAHAAPAADVLIRGDAGRLTTVDVGKLPAMAEAATARLRAANESAKRLAQKLEVVVGTFCRALARREGGDHA